MLDFLRRFGIAMVISFLVVMSLATVVWLGISFVNLEFVSFPDVKTAKDARLVFATWVFLSSILVSDIN